MRTQRIPLSDIKVGERQRTDLGDIDGLADSLERYGLIQPIVLDDSNNLIAGGRRLAAATSLEWTDIPAVYLGQLTADERAELELEENVRRKEMTWQERVLGIDKIFSLRQLNAMRAGQKWGYRETGELLGMTHSNVHYAITAAKFLRAGDAGVAKCQNLNEVVKLMLQRKEDETLKYMANETLVDAKPLAEPLGSSVLVSCDGLEVIERKAVTIPLRLYNEDALKFLEDLAQPSSVDHFITDPPYAIDMDNIQQDGGGQNVERTASEHQVPDNIGLLHSVIPLMFKALPAHGFAVLWCDQENWYWLQQIALLAGFRVQRWPLVWIKTDPCQNMAATYNFTKKTEIAMVLRKPGATLNQAQPSNYCVCGGEDRKLFAHPFAKPRDLWKWVINAVSQPGQVICDPFAGSGTCPAACIEVGRNILACEKVEAHYNELIENIKRTYRNIHGPDVRFS